MSQAILQKDTALRALAPTTRRDQVATALRAAILSGELPVGMPLLEAKLSSQLGVSRGPLREAISILTQEGLLVARPYAGVTVAELDKAALREIYTIRRQLELYALELVWPRRTPAFREEFKAAYNDFIAAIDTGDRAAELDAEMRFHGVIYEYAGHRLLLTLFRQLARKIQLALVAYREDGEAFNRRKIEQRTYMAAVLGDDFDEAVRQLKQRLESGLAFVERLAIAETSAAHPRDAARHPH